jgi:hypothetical protein
LDGVLFDIAFLKNSVDGIEWRQSQNFALLGKGENIEGKRIYSKDSYIFGLVPIIDSIEKSSMSIVLYN